MKKYKDTKDLPDISIFKRCPEEFPALVQLNKKKYKAKML